MMNIEKELLVDEKLRRRNAIRPCFVSYMNSDRSLDSSLFKAKEQDSTLFCSRGFVGPGSSALAFTNPNTASMANLQKAGDVVPLGIEPRTFRASTICSFITLGARNCWIVKRTSYH